MTDRCTICGKRLDDGRPVQRSLDGEGAHMECLETVEIDDEEDERG